MSTYNTEKWRCWRRIVQLDLCPGANISNLPADGELADIIKRIGNPTTFWDVIRGLDPKKPYQPPAHATGPIAGLMNEEQIRAIVREEMLKAQGEHEEVKAAEEQGLPWDE